MYTYNDYSMNTTSYQRKKPFEKYISPKTSGAYTQAYHNIYNNSNWIIIKYLDVRLSEGDIITVFSQFGEIVSIYISNNIGICYIEYELHFSTVMATDAMNSAPEYNNNNNNNN
eukprot:Tbor_TRINITY_DN5369_c3_g2::TRINITY_DN5369_c3_g2_i12::g.3956::m.3956/K13107/RBMX2, IST3; RNA-binding motif protein, X-linked 2